MGGLRYTTSGRRPVIGFLAVTVSSMIVLGAATLYLIRSLVIANRQLEQVSQSLDATWRLHLTLSEAVIPLQEYLLRGGREQRLEFERQLRVVEEKWRSCAATACHGGPRTPADVAEQLMPTMSQLREKGRRLFQTARPGHGPDALTGMQEIDELLSVTNEQLHRMSSAHLARVNALRDQSHAVIQRAAAFVASMTFAIVLLMCGVAVLARRISRPVPEIVLGTRRMTAGDWMARVPAAEFRSAVRLLAAIVVTIFLFEAAIMSLLPFLPPLSAPWDALLDGLTLTVLIFPVLYLFSFRPLVRHMAERERAHEELRRQREALYQTEKLAAMGKLLAGVGHELNNPLTSILMNANLMMEEAGPESPLCKDLEKVGMDAARCKRIIDDLHIFSRRRELHKTPCQVAAVIDQALQMVRHELDLRGIQVEREVEAGLPTALWDPERMAQVLTNFFINAIHAMENGGRLTVNARHAGGWVILEVRDTGTGIAPEHRTRIFDPFFTTKPEGTGLGLSISYGIVQDHGGRIEVESLTREEAGPEREAGTTVRVFLPH